MKKIILAYFPILLTFIQLMLNTIFILENSFYKEYGFYFSNLFGQSLIFSFFLVFYTFYFRFCSISRVVSIAQVIISVGYIFIKDDNIYNVVFQQIVLTLSLLATLKLYYKKFPNCILAVNIFFAKILVKNLFHCENALNEFKEKSYQKSFKKYENGF